MDVAFGSEPVEWRDTAAPACLAAGTELVGEYRGSGRREAPFLARRGDGRMVELSALLYLVASCLDGVRQPAEIAAIVSERAGRLITADGVIYLLDHKLRPLGLLGDRGGARSPARSGVPLLGLQLRGAVAPAALVRVLAAALCPLFAPVVVASVIAGVMAVDAWMLVGHRVGRGGISVLYRPGLLLMVLGLIVLSAAFHELGHAAASRYGGAEPGAIGLGVYLLWPVFYNDLTDTYRLGRAGRLRADLGGIYFNAVFILILAGAYGLTGFQPLLLVVSVEHLLLLQQFLPFVRLDGYYIVSDLAGEPDLFGRIRPVMGWLFAPWAFEDSVSDLRPRVRYLVIGWVVLTVPLLAAGAVLLLWSLPHLVRVEWRSLRIQGRGFMAAITRGSAGWAAVSGLETVILSIPFVGLSATAARAVLRVSRSSSQSFRSAMVVFLGATICVLLLAALAALAGVLSPHRTLMPGPWGRTVVTAR